MNKISAASDEELIAMLKNGVFGAFSELYERYWSAMLAKAFDRLKSQEDAEEVVQELFIKIWQRREKITLQYSFKTYIYAALRYETLDFVAKQIHLKNQLSIDEADLQLLIQEEGFYSLEMKELQQQVNEIINSLPEKCRLIFKMSRNEGLNTREIAIELNLSTRTVETQISKALKLLRRTLKNINSIFF